MNDLIKISLTSKLNSLPVLNFDHYNDEIIEGNKVYKNVFCAKTPRNLIELNSISFIYNEIDCNVEFFSIVKKEESKEVFKDIVHKMYEYISEFLNKEIEKIKNNIETSSIPDDNYILEEINKSIQEENQSLKINMDVNQFMVELVNDIQNRLDVLKKEQNVDSEKFDGFFASIMNLNSLKSLVNGLTVLKVKNDMIEFNSKEKYDEVLNAVSNKISFDIMGRYLSIDK